MAAIANDLDVFLAANPAPAEPAPANRDLLLLPSTPGGFKVSSGNLVTPSSITFDAVPLAMPGAVVGFSATGGTITTSGNRATLTAANATTDSITVTATVTFEGVTYTRSATVQKNYDGTNGISPNKNHIAFLWKWSTSAPTKPAGTSTFTWASLANTAYGGADGWSITVPTNPGTPLIQLFVAQVPVTDVAAATSTTVGYSSSTVAAWAQNGSNGSNGATGAQFDDALLYQWAATIPAGPVGSPTFIWATGLFGAAPANWSLTPDTAPSPGMTLWQARVRITDSAASTQTAFNWSAASILAVGSSGTNGNNGTPAMYVEISTSGGQVFSRGDSTGTFAPASITLTATPYGGTATYQWQYWTGSAWTNIASATAATTPIASGSFTGSRVFRVQATIAGTVYTDEMTLVQVTGGKDGVDSVRPFLTNQSVTVAAGTDGTVSGGFGSAGGTFKLFDGLTDKTGNAAVVYSVFAESGVDVSIAATGVYSVVSMGADTGTATLRAVYGGVTYDQIYSISKARAGASITGAEGVSYVTAYCASTTASTTTAPANTTGKTSFPVANAGGITGTWSKTVPALTSGQFMYQSDGLYDPATNQVTWSIPYWSSLKVASLSAIAANLGAITGGSIDIGTGATSWHVDALGNMWIGAAAFASAPFRVTNAGAVVATNLTVKSGSTDILTPTGLQPGFEAPGTKNNEQQWAEVGGAGRPSDYATAGGELVVSDFVGGLSNWTNSLAGAPETLPDIASATRVTTDGHFGVCCEVTNLDTDGERVMPKGAINVVPGRIYRLTTVFKCVTLPDGPASWENLFAFLDASYVSISSSARDTLVVSTAQQVTTITSLTSTVAGTGIYVMPATTRFIRAGMRIASTEASAPTVRIKSIRVEDVTDAFNAQVAADTANTAITGINTTLGDKLSRTAASILTGQVTISTSGLVQIGTAANGTTISPTGIAATKAGVANYTQTATGDVTARSFTALATDGSIVFTTGKTLIEQIMSAPNLASRLSSWGVSGSAAVTTGSVDDRFVNGEYLWLPSTSAQAMGTSNPLNIPRNAPYTVSFDAYCESGTKAVSVDVFGSGVDSNGLSPTLTTTIKKFKFSETMADVVGAPQAFLRIFTGASGGSNIIVSNVKVELGVTATPWCDNVITAQNASTFIAAGAFGTLSAYAAYIGNLEIGPTGSIRQGSTGYYAGTGMWFGMHSGIPKMHIGTPGASCMYWDGTDLVIEKPKLALATFTASCPVNPATTGTGTSRSHTVTASVTGGKAPLKYTWTVYESLGSLRITAGQGTLTISVNAFVAARPGEASGYVELTVVDADGRTALAGFDVDDTFT